MTTVYPDRLCTVSDLCEITGEAPARLREEFRMEDGPDTIQKGRQTKVWLSVYRDWTLQMYGRNGERRGQDAREITI